MTDNQRRYRYTPPPVIRSRPEDWDGDGPEPDWEEIVEARRRSRMRHDPEFYDSNFYDITTRG